LLCAAPDTAPLKRTTKAKTIDDTLTERFGETLNFLLPKLLVGLQIIPNPAQKSIPADHRFLALTYDAVQYNLMTQSDVIQQKLPAW
jgi:hypothetical protein